MNTPSLTLVTVPSVTLLVSPPAAVIPKLTSPAFSVVIRLPFASFAVNVSVEVAVSSAAILFGDAANVELPSPASGVVPAVSVTVSLRPLTGVPFAAGTMV
ncbi:Uncharacterised protein [Serratia marcescens]|uniref:Uncharacterized protein n=1 Tax=Serratia marcescens TaxID=615 RepID=A0A379Y367_SERMA|nr:Uncharacterised protein [Serratia marcescens]